MHLDPEDFPEEFSPGDLKIERFLETRKVRDLDCGTPAHIAPK